MTGHRAAMSYPGLVGYAHHPQAKSEEFSNKIVFFNVESRAAEMTDRRRVIERMRRFVCARNVRLRDSQTRSATMSIARSKRNLRPLLARGARYFILVSRRLWVSS